jgi:dihydroorotase
MPVNSYFGFNGRSATPWEGKAMDCMLRTVLALFVFGSAVLAQANYDLLLKGGRVIDPKNGINALMDVAVKDGKIARVAPGIPAAEAAKAVNVEGLTVTPGLIDIHVHVYQRPENRAMDRDSNVQAGAHTFRSGVTTVVDAGTAGWRDLPEFRRRAVQKSRTRVLALVNISGSGMGPGSEDDLAELDVDAAIRAANSKRDIVVGF